MSGAKKFFKLTDNGIQLFIRASPGASKDEISGLWRGEGGARLAVKVTAPPDKGKANAAIVKLLAKRLGLPKSSLSVAAGETSRLKTVTIKGDAGAIAASLRKLTGEQE